MTEALHPSATGSPLARLFDIATTAHLTPRHIQDEERELAETAAADHIYTAYPETLGQAVDQDAWTRFPAGQDNNFQPSAVAHLDGGLWLHHSISAGGGYRDGLTLLVPCTCGHGYVAFVLEDENDLLELLEELRPTGGHAVHRGDTGGPYCASTPTR
ncbi:hypothetical protein ACIQJ8_33205 [Streptomyces globisporus]|uniref:hypothetical protein n=1 Tax=Streptomyces globisporus TaxID=1908 RepID=UPI002F913223|nr:hypothetical protein OG449_34985 [Streptomyces globisporus]